jgi:hypothetical protein
MKNYACWNKIRDEPMKDCPLECKRKEIQYTAPTWFDGWVTTTPENCQYQVRDAEKIKNMFNNFFG